MKGQTVMKNKIRVIAICGKSGSGKDFLLKSFFSWEDSLSKGYSPYCQAKIASTRPMRDGEAQYTPYHFMSEEKYQKSIEEGSVKYSTCFNNWYYGVEKLNSEGINIGVFNLEMIEQMAADPNIQLDLIYVDTDDKTRLTRSLMREANPDCFEICRRFMSEYENKAFDNIKESALLTVDGSRYFGIYTYTSIKAAIENGQKNFQAEAAF